MKDNHLMFITISKIPSIYGISRATVYRWIESGQLPEPIRLSPRIVGWKRSVLDDVFFGGENESNKRTN
ncbi:MAG TPA: AlpA family phage regulatory protein [Gammaproteobacteria bacterium]|nr:AlpA family phage regulatory protein [Gammaproteobacteria bacterium]